VTSRRLAPIAVPTGPDVLDVLLPPLQAALSGDGPALLPYPAGGAPAAELRPGEPLGPGEDDPADPTVVVLATSGSTGRPKGALLPASALLASASASHDRIGGPGRWLLALPAEHVAGLQVLIRSLIARTRPVVLDLADGFDPDRFAAAASRLTGIRRYTALVPTQLGRLLAAGPGVRAELARFDAVLIGGAAASTQLLDRARSAGVRVVTTYGMSETCGGCVYDGVPLDGVSVAIDQDGRIALAGPVLARGYRGHDPDDGADGFGADADGRRWFRTDDAGGWDADGRLVLHGRLDDIIVTGGLKVAPAVVETALAGLPGVVETVVVGVPDPEWGQRVVAVLVLEPGQPRPELDRVRRWVGERIDGRAAPRQVLVLDALPLRGPGKPDRAGLARLAAGNPPAGSGPTSR